MIMRKNNKKKAIVEKLYKEKGLLNIIKPS